jgi:hypothetical protein
MAWISARVSSAGFRNDGLELHPPGQRVEGITGAETSPTDGGVAGGAGRLAPSEASDQGELTPTEFPHEP